MLQTIFHKCGHQRVVDMGLMSRKRRIDYAEQLGANTCPDCERDEIKEYEKTNALPLLQGSEKQVRWGSKIRFIKLIGRYPKTWDKTNAEAKYWIENRNRLKGGVTQ